MCVGGGGAEDKGGSLVGNRAEKQCSIAATAGEVGQRPACSHQKQCMHGKPFSAGCAVCASSGNHCQPLTACLGRQLPRPHCRGIQFADDCGSLYFSYRSYNVGRTPAHSLDCPGTAPWLHWLHAYAAVLPLAWQGLLTIWNAPTIFCKLEGRSETFCAVLMARHCSTPAVAATISAAL